MKTFKINIKSWDAYEDRGIAITELFTNLKSVASVVVVTSTPENITSIVKGKVKVKGNELEIKWKGATIFTLKKLHIKSVVQLAGGQIYKVTGKKKSTVYIDTGDVLETAKG